jgi:hypothetical protein
MRERERERERERLYEDHDLTLLKRLDSPT